MRRPRPDPTPRSARRRTRSEGPVAERGPGRPTQEVTRLRRRIDEMRTSVGDFRRTLHTAEEARRFAEAVFDTVREPMLVLDEGLRVMAANRSFYRTFQSAPKETLRRFVYDLGGGHWNIARLRLLLEKVLPHDHSFEGFDVELDLPVIGRRVMLLNARSIERPGSNQGTILLAFEDVTERRRSEDELRSAAVTDTLTGLRNRRGLFAGAKEFMKRLKEPGREGLVILFMDVDGLKAVNDRHGHEEGDLLLAEAARLIRVTFPEALVVARLGGDEFVAVLDDAPSARPDALLSRLREAVVLDNRERRRPLPLSISAGVSRVARGTNRSFSRILADADAAMYRAKGRRRRRTRS